MSLLSDDFLSAILDHLGDRIAVADADGRMLFVNEAMRAGHPGVALTPATTAQELGFLELDGDTPLDDDRLPLPRALAGERVVGEEVVCRPPGRDDARRLLLDAAPLHDAQGRRLGAIWTASDVTEMRETELRLAETNLVLRAVADAARDLRVDGDVPQALCQAARLAAGAPFAAVFQPDGEHLVATGAAGCADPQPRSLTTPQDAADAVVRAFRTGEQVLTDDVLAHPIAHGDEPIGVLAVGCRTTTGERAAPSPLAVQLLADEAAVALERAGLVAQLRDLSLRDPLTGLLNRRAWDDELARELSRARRHAQPLCVALLDLDHFKAYNDRMGHQTGDWLLRSVAATWSSLLRETDVVARWGGEEFAVCLPNCSPAEAEAVVARLRHHVPDGQTCSAGLVQWDGDEDAAGLLRRADRALYAAKDAGRDRLVRA